MYIDQNIFTRVGNKKRKLKERNSMACRVDVWKNYFVFVRQVIESDGQSELPGRGEGWPFYLLR